MVESMTAPSWSRSTNVKRWTVGELATAAGVTVRTLHHYDRIGLVRQSERTQAQHRRYAAGDVARLYRVLALRDFGFGLDRIAELLSSAHPTKAPAMPRTPD
jgi:DNA-binding transcriptional MerR regulator